jgi:drug/metabolite transporter (DMT)-like permease
MQTMQRLLPYFCLVAGMAVAGSYVALSKPLVAVIPVFILAALRFSIAGFIMLPWLKTPPGASPLPRDVKRWLFVQSFLGNFLFSACMLYGVALSGALTAGIVMAGIPAAVALLSWAVLRERVALRTWGAIALSCGAVLCLGFASQFDASSPAKQATHLGWGTALLLAAVLCEATYVVLAKRLGPYLSPKRNSALLNAWGWALTLPFAVWQALDSGFSIGSVSLVNWGLLVYYAVSASVLSTWLWFTGLKAIPASRAAVFTVALPMTAALLGVTVLGEAFNAWHGLALGLAVSSVFLVAENQRR